MNYEGKLKISGTIAIVLYILFLIWALYFKFGDVDYVRFCSENLAKLTFKERFLFDIIPFDFRNTDQKLLHLVINILNIFVFMPLGIVIPIRYKKTSLKMQSLFCFLLSLLFEIVQLFTLIGGFATDDLLMNTLGFFAGALFYYYLFKNFSDKVNYYILMIFNMILGVVLIYAFFTVVPVLGQYIQIIKDFAF